MLLKWVLKAISLVTIFEVYHIKVGKLMTTQSHLILVVVAWSEAFLFHIEMISS